MACTDALLNYQDAILIGMSAAGLSRVRASLDLQTYMHSAERLGLLDRYMIDISFVLLHPCLRILLAIYNEATACRICVSSSVALHAASQLSR
jgi:hypothetical protein